MQCDACRREPVVYQPYSGKHLCRSHFFVDFETKAKHTIRSHGWLQPGNHIAAVLDGGALSAALLVFLAKLVANRRDVRLFAVTIDTGESGNPAPEQARTVAASCGVEWFCGSFVERYGTTLDEIVHQNGSDAAGRICRVLTNDFIGEIAEAHGATLGACATAVDERACAFFSDLLSGTSERTLFSSEVPGKTRIPLIRPFMGIPAPEVVLYAKLHRECAGCDVLPPPCGPDGDYCAPDAKAALDNYDRRHPAAKFALANLAQTLTGIAARQEPPPVCPECGEPVMGGVCESCAIRRKFDRRALT